MIPGGIINYCIRFIASLIFGPPIFVLLPEHANETRHLPIWKEVKFVDRDPHWYTRRVKEAIHIILHSNNINRCSIGGACVNPAWSDVNFEAE